MIVKGVMGVAVDVAVFTVQSAVQMWRGQGGLWKGRAQAIAS